MDTINVLWANMKQTLACVGLDPDIRKFPNSVKLSHQRSEDAVYSFLCTVIDRTAKYVCAYKVQKAFFDLYSGGHDLLREVIHYIHANYPLLPVIVDCKIGDIENTMDAYIENIFGVLKADGVLANPYMGLDVVLPLMEMRDKAIVVLCKTSNQGGSIIQDVPLWNNQPLWQHVLKQVTTSWNRNGNMIPVVSSTAELNISYVRALIPSTMPILLAGVGSQGGNLDNLGVLLNRDRSGVFVNSSRGILYSYALDDADWADKTELAVYQFTDALNAQR
jgi:orotidine-5'-phosphate decarboxylase